MSNALGISKELLIDIINDKGGRDETIRLLRTRFESYVDTHGRDAIRADLARPLGEREIITTPEMADSALIWLKAPTASESSTRMTKVLMVAAVVECAITLSFNILPYLQGIA